MKRGMKRCRPAQRRKTRLKRMKTMRVLFAIMIDARSLSLCKRWWCYDALVNSANRLTFAQKGVVEASSKVMPSMYEMKE